MIEITLSGPIRGKGRPRFVRQTGRAYTPAQTVNYEAALRIAAQDAMAGRAPLDGPCELVAVAAFAVPSSWSAKKTAKAIRGEILPTVKPDGDNILKLTDALNGVCFVDDKQIVRAEITKVYAVAPELRLSIHEYPRKQELW